MRNIISFFGIGNWALAATTNSIVSNLIGQNKKDDVFKIIKKIMTISTGAALITCILLNCFPQLVLSVYGQSDAFMQQGIPVIRVLSGAMVLMSLGIVWLSAVTGTGNSRVTFLIELTAIIAYCLYIYYTLEIRNLSIVWGWMSEILYWIILFSLSFSYMRSNRWRKKVL